LITIIFAIIIKYFSWKLLLESLFIQIITWIYLIIFGINSLITTTFVYLISYYFNLKTNKMNRNLNVLLNSKRLNSYQVSITVKSFIFEHNQICVQISSFNKFWKKLYLIFVFTVIPMSLCFLHQFLSEEIELFVRFYIGFAVLVEFVVIFFFQFMIASISSSMHKSVNNLSRLQWAMNGWLFRTRTKIKLLACFERMSSKRKIGFSIGSLAVMTFPLFYKVIFNTFF